MEQKDGKPTTGFWSEVKSAFRHMNPKNLKAQKENVDVSLGGLRVEKSGHLEANLEESKAFAGFSVNPERIEK